MGTRADFYIGRGPDSEWLGSQAYDGYPSAALLVLAMITFFPVYTLTLVVFGAVGVFAVAMTRHVLRVAHTSPADQSTINLDDEFHKWDAGHRT